MDTLQTNVGFRLIDLEIEGHPCLRDLKLSFCKDEELLNDGPFVTLLIGANGTGKSYILRTIIDIFRDVEETKKAHKKSLSINYGYTLQYKYEDNIYKLAHLRCGL